MDHISITNEPLSVDQISNIVTSPTSGAISMFIGKEIYYSLVISFRLRIIRLWEILFEVHQPSRKDLISVFVTLLYNRKMFINYNRNNKE